MSFIAHFVLIVTGAFLVFLVVPNKQQRDYIIITLMMVISCLGGSILALGQLGIL